MKLLITAVCVLMMHVSFGQESLENESKYEYEYGISLSVGEFQLNTNNFDEAFKFVNSEFELSLNQAINKQWRVVYGFAISRLTPKTGSEINQFNPSFCYGCEASNNPKNKELLYNKKESYLIGFKLGVAYTLLDIGGFKPYLAANIQPFYNVSIDKGISPGTYSTLNLGAGANFKIAKQILVGVGFEMGQNPSAIVSMKSNELRIINYQSSLSFLFQL